MNQEGLVRHRNYKLSMHYNRSLQARLHYLTHVRSTIHYEEE